ncbi:hypothetical protein [Acinetobacter dispersus]|uniref:hypothetical protein n=1 Tax=Acinetobacter dispersus TaxID=70348 RepID=UPI001F4B85F6|nr:hypothetical protein [Acinetobacter dispersus]MCH7390279.1 hypothetical protein [Acinetobacter dispersus]
MENTLEINGYKIFENDDEAVYAAKSKEDVYNFFVENYGPTEECQDQTKEQFIEQLIEIEIDSDSAQRLRTWHNDDTGEITESSYYQEYKNAAVKDQGTDVIAYLVW